MLKWQQYLKPTEKTLSNSMLLACEGLAKELLKSVSNWEGIPLIQMFSL